MQKPKADSEADRIRHTEEHITYYDLQDYEPFVLTKTEMLDRKGDSKRGGRYGRSIPRTREKWEAKSWGSFHRAWEKVNPEVKKMSEPRD